MLKQFKNLNIFKIYIIFLFFLSSFYLSAVYLSTVNNAMSEWVINYGGGFVRRGLVGEIIFQLSIFFKVKLREGFLILQILLYFFYYFLIYWLLSGLKKNFITSLAIFSPVFYSFGLYELEALGRKEILMYIFFSYNFYLFYKYKNINLNYIFTYLSLIVLILNHESVIFYYLFYLFFFIAIDKKKDLRFYLLNILLFLIVILTSYFIYTNPHTSAENLEMCRRLLNQFNEKCGLGASYTTANVSRHVSEVEWRLKDIINYIFIFIFGFIGIFLLICKSKLTNKFYILDFKFLSIIIFCSLPGLLLFLIAVDSGRWTSMLYHMIAICFFGMIKLGHVKMELNIKYKNIDFNKVKNKFLFFLLVFFLCFGWSPKAINRESFGTFPAYRMILKVPKFFKINFKDPDHFFKFFIKKNFY
jgi:hypothetical protein